MNRIDFKAYAESAFSADSRHSYSVIEKELLHYEILKAMAEGGYLDKLAFQGGTCLRLCYGAPRYSVDLDFAAGSSFIIEDLEGMGERITNALNRKFEVDARVKAPRMAKTNPAVYRWVVSVNTNLSRPDIPHQVVQIEATSVDSYTIHPREVLMNYESLPVHLGDVIVNAETLDEIIADKIVSFVCSNHVRYKDLWDLNWALTRPGLDWDLIKRLRDTKLDDYCEAAKYDEHYNRVEQDLGTIIESDEMHNELKSYLPVSLFDRTLADRKYRNVMLTNLSEMYCLMDDD
jgi:predicted nucleotidyltransferase component of viral defense system